VTTGAARKRLVIHAGLGKSGSSAIQKYLRDHATELQAAEALYLGMFLERGDPSPLGFASPDDLQRALADDRAIEDRLVALLTARIGARPGVSTFVWSHIALAMQPEVLGRVIGRLAPVCDTEVILYFRHQASWLVSAYLQWGIKHKTTPGPIRSFDDWLPEAQSRGADYRRVIERWQAAVGTDQLRVRSYDRAEDIVADFLAATQLPIAAPDPENTRHYATPDPAVMTLFRLYQGQEDGDALPGGLQRALTANGVDRKRYREVDPASTLPTGAAWQELIASFEETNAALAHDFGLILEAPAEGPSPDPSFAAPATVVPALLDLIISMDRRIAGLERRLKQVEQTGG
jgi:hypothetical protein